MSLRTIVAGSRDFKNFETACAVLDACPWTVGRVVSGTAAGADKLGERWAALRGIPVDRFPAQWHLYGPRAGNMRNLVMAQNADALVAFWNGTSAGTKNMIETAGRYGLRVFVHYV